MKKWMNFEEKKFILKDEDEDLEKKMANLIQLEREYEKVVMIHDYSWVFITRE